MPCPTQLASDPSSHRRPARVHLTRSLPKTRNGKILRRLVRSAYLGQPPGDTTSLESPDALDHIRHCRPGA